MDPELAGIVTTSMPYTVESLMTAGGAIISGAFWKLWKRVEADHKKVQEEWIKCEEEHIKTQTDLAGLREDIGFLRGRQEATENLARSVLEVVARND